MKAEKHDFDRFLTDPTFAELKRRLDRFNIFTALGVERAELRHSEFLSSLLDPSGSHRIGDRFLVNFLVRATSGGTCGFSPADVLIADWTELRVRREWRYIDILLVDHSQGFVCCIENKVGADEHGDQLSRYVRTVDETFPSCNYPKRLFLFLSPEGDRPSHEAFLPVSYSAVIESAKTVQGELDSATGIGYVLAQYIELIGSRVMKDDELTKLCREIYRRHRAVLDKVWELGAGDTREQISEFLIELVKAAPARYAIQNEWSTKTIVRFADGVLDGQPWMNTSQGWSDSGRILLYEFTIKKDAVLIELVLGMGDETIRQAIFAACNTSPFSGGARLRQWHRLWRETILDRTDFESLDEGETTFDNLLSKIRNHWTNFLDRQLPALRAGLSRIDIP